MKLEYKAEAQGRHVVKLDQWFASSKLCSCCGHKMPEMPLHQRNWACPACNAVHDRDINAAINIRQQGILELKAAGHVVSTHGGRYCQFGSSGLRSGKPRRLRRGAVTRAIAALHSP